MTPQLLQIDSITRDNTLQVRGGLDWALVRTYQKARERGVPFLPISVAQVEGALLLVDGWHRLEAARECGADEVECLVERMTLKEAFIAAACANTAHGKPLSRDERRSAFRLFIRGRGHKGEKGYLSYRDISGLLGGQAGHTTIRNWMLKDFPKIARAMGGTEGGNAQAETPKLNMEHMAYTQTTQAITDALNHYDRLGCPENRYEIIKRAEKMLQALKEKEHVAPEF
jgi:hypothetical protein